MAHRFVPPILTKSGSIRGGLRARARVHHHRSSSLGFDDDPNIRPRKMSTSVGGISRVRPWPTQKPAFGIVAAVSSDGVIGIDGKLPWNAPIPQDRAHFVSLTRNKVLIVGRKTFAEEDPTGAHVDHVRVCIVVSRTMTRSDLPRVGGSGPEVMLARSFDDALDLASLEMMASNHDGTHPDGETDESNNRGDAPAGEGAIGCWVAGGEGIYEEALGHDCASEVHLTHVDFAVEEDAKHGSAVARFPMGRLEECGFEEVSRVDTDGVCSFRVYRRP